MIFAFFIFSIIKYYCNLVRSQPINDAHDRDQPPIKKKYTNFVSSSATSNPKPVNSNFSLNIKKSEYDLIIVKLEYQPDENPCNILNRSAGFSKANLSWEYAKETDKFRCDVKLQNNLIHSAKGDSKAESRDNATKEVLEILESKCYTIIVKNKYLSDGTTIDANELEAVKEEKKELPGSNIGKPKMWKF